MKSNRLIVVAVALTLASGARVQADITITGPAATNHIPSSICPVMDGTNHLNPDPVGHLAPPKAGEGVMKELTNTVNTTFSNWTFTVGAALNGTLTIDYYKSVFVDDHDSGGKISATYAPATNDPSTLRFIQMVDTDSPLHGGKPPYIDPYPSDDPTNAPPLPFYWTEEETKDHGLNFRDFSQRYHPPTSGVVWRGYLYLASWNGTNPGTVNIHDGIKWGWDAGCVATNIPTQALRIVEETGARVISWITNALDKPSGRLEHTAQLGPLAAWESWTNRVDRTNSEFRTLVATPLPQEFFRLSLPLTNPPPPVVRAFVRVPPMSKTVMQGSPTTLSVKADGSGTVGYQWYAGTGMIPGATNRVLTFSHVQFTNQGPYFAVVFNSLGSETSDTALLTVQPDFTPPAIVSATASSDRLQITVHFSEPVSPDTALDPTNYQVQGELGPIFISGAAAGSDESIVLLTPSLSTPLQPNSQYFLQAHGISDFATPPNFLPPGSSATFNTGLPDAAPEM